VRREGLLRVMRSWGKEKFTEGDEKVGQGMLLSEFRRWDKEDLLR
jgi:hypothetical protein